MGWLPLSDLRQLWTKSKLEGFLVLSNIVETLHFRSNRPYNHALEKVYNHGVKNPNNHGHENPNTHEGDFSYTHGVDFHSSRVVDFRFSDAGWHDAPYPAGHTSGTYRYPVSNEKK